MTQIHDMFNEGFRSHADAVARSGGLGEDFERGAVKSIRRRRTTRAAGYGAGSALAIGAVGVAAWVIPGQRQGTVAPAGTQGCEINPYLPRNQAAIAVPSNLLRTYIDLRPESEDKKVIVVYPGGDYVEVEANDDGAFVLDNANGGFEVLNLEPLYPGEYDSAWVMDELAGGGETRARWDGTSPYVSGYGWTTVVPDEVPAGIDLSSLSATLDTSMSGGTGYWPGAVPEGAVTDVIMTSEDGVETTRLHDGDASPSVEAVQGASRVEMRVSGLPDGGTFSIVSTFDANDIPEPTCLPGAVNPTSIPEPTASL